jgi:hypothetical protein
VEFSNENTVYTISLFYQDYHLILTVYKTSTIDPSEPTGLSHSYEIDYTLEYTDDEDEDADFYFDGRRIDFDIWQQSYDLPSLYDYQLALNMQFFNKPKSGPKKRVFGRENETAQLMCHINDCEDNKRTRTH